MKIYKTLTILCIILCCSGYAVAQDKPTRIAEGQIALTWDPNEETDLGGYKIYMGTSSGVYDNTIDVENVNKYVVNGLVSGITYYLALTAYDTSFNESDYSTEVSAVAKDKTAPKLPTGFREVVEIVNITAKTVNIITN
jgi:fibronectin type 3 domain-containing protein